MQIKDYTKHLSSSDEIEIMRLAINFAIAISSTNIKGVYESILGAMAENAKESS